MSDFGYNVQRPIFRKSNPNWIMQGSEFKKDEINVSSGDM